MTFRSTAARIGSAGGRLFHPLAPIKEQHMPTNPRIAVLSALSSPGWHPVPEAHGMPWDEAEQLLAAYDASRAAAPAVVPSAPADRADELAKHVTRAIHALKSPAPAGSEHYRSGWDDGLEAAIDAARDAVLRRMADEAQQPTSLAETIAAKRQEPAFVQLAEAWSTDGGLIDEAQQPETQADAQGALLATRCDACRHTLNWHRNDVGCTVALCVCGRFQDPAAVSQPGKEA